MDQEFSQFELSKSCAAMPPIILAVREKPRIMHHKRDSRAAHNEVKIAFQRGLLRKLDSSYYIGQGHNA